MGGRPSGVLYFSVALLEEPSTPILALYAVCRRTRGSDDDEWRRTDDPG
jgi:hypothetical protein